MLGNFVIFFAALLAIFGKETLTPGNVKKNISLLLQYIGQQVNFGPTWFCFKKDKVYNVILKIPYLKSIFLCPISNAFLD